MSSEIAVDYKASMGQMCLKTLNKIIVYFKNLTLKTNERRQGGWGGERDREREKIKNQS